MGKVSICINNWAFMYNQGKMQRNIHKQLQHGLSVLDAHICLLTLTQNHQFFPRSFKFTIDLTIRTTVRFHTIIYLRLLRCNDTRTCCFFYIANWIFHVFREIMCKIIRHENKTLRRKTKETLCSSPFFFANDRGRCIFFLRAHSSIKKSKQTSRLRTTFVSLFVNAQDADLDYAKDVLEQKISTVRFVCALLCYANKRFFRAKIQPE